MLFWPSVSSAHTHTHLDGCTHSLLPIRSLLKCFLIPFIFIQKQLLSSIIGLMFLKLYVCMYIYIYIFIHTHLYIYVCGCACAFIIQRTSLGDYNPHAKQSPLSSSLTATGNKVSQEYLKRRSLDDFPDFDSGSMSQGWESAELNILDDAQSLGNEIRQYFLGCLSLRKVPFSLGGQAYRCYLSRRATSLHCFRGKLQGEPNNSLTKGQGQNHHLLCVLRVQKGWGTCPICGRSYTWLMPKENGI